MLDLIWITKEGERLRISDMETRHINNCVAKILRSKRGWRREYLDRLLLELEIRAASLTSRKL